MKKRILPFFALLLITSMSYAQTRTIQVTVPDTVQVMYIAGTINGWSEPGDEMTMVSDTVYTFEFDAADTAGIEFKFLSGPYWKYEQVQAANFRFSTDSITRVDEFKAIYDTAYAKDVTIEVLVPVEVIDLYITGNFNGWTPDANQMEKIDSTQDGKVFTATINTLDTTALEFKFIAGPDWAYEQTESANYVYSEDGATVVCDEFKAIYDPNALGDITLNIVVPEGTPDVWIIGSFAGWDTTQAVHATQVDDTTWTAVIENVGNIEYKVYNHPNWTFEEASDATGTSVDNRAASFLSGPEFDIKVLFWKDIFEVPTAVNDYENSKIRVYTTRYQTVVAEGVAEKVTIFDVQGRIVEDARTTGTFMSKALRTGVYMIRVDNHIQKVAIQ